ncbi:hypothetical protein [Bradyrhizobium liaoningense]|uniref:hypothetical protein n=1 Tax=Bradyrhizobium liaoningense TaxID=43992 RepID=UPI001BA5C356|nr:hypothetical protein [Bradyrhizobium liaoningense]MBR0715820.1 hypothetical protein [Bradyrhizobium liaoningense]
MATCGSLSGWHPSVSSGRLARPQGESETGLSRQNVENNPMQSRKPIAPDFRGNVCYDVEALDKSAAQAQRRPAKDDGKTRNHGAELID